MKSKKMIAPSILSADFAILAEEIAAVEKAGADWIHVDVMDGHFVPNLTIGPVVVGALKKRTSLPLDVHLMIENPEKYVPEFVKAGATYVTIHAEAAPDLSKGIAQIKSLGAKAGVSVNPGTPIDAIKDVLHLVDLVLVMTVNPGFGGQKMIEACLEKSKKLVQWRKEKNLSFLIEVDGGVSESTCAAVSEAGCDVFVAGSAVFGAKDYAKAIQGIRSKI